MLLRSHIASLEKFVSGLFYLALLLCISAFFGYAGYMPALPEESIRTEIVFSDHQQAHKTLSWKKAISVVDGDDSKLTTGSGKVNFSQLSRLHDKRSNMLYDYLATQFIVCLTPKCFALLKIIPQSSDELPSSLSIV